jgi:putative DNA primase/helicase
MAAARVNEGGVERRIFCRAKSNIGPDTGGWEYRLDLASVPGVPGVTAVYARWGEALEGSARDLLAEAEATEDPEERGELDEAVDWLRKLLVNGSVDSKQIRSDAKESGVAWRTVERAKTRLGAKASKASFSGGWRWSLPDHGDQDDPQGSQDSTPENLGGLGKSESLEPRRDAGSTEGRQPPKDNRQNRGVGGLRSNPGGARVSGDHEVEDRQDRQSVAESASPEGDPGQIEVEI